MDYAALYLYVIVATFTPGPNNLMSFYLCAENGLKGGIKYIIGAVMGFTSLFFIFGWLNLWLSKFVPIIEPYIKWFGVLYLLFLAVYIIVGGKKNKSNGGSQSGLNTIPKGFLLQYVNVKGLIFSLTVFSMYITPYVSSYSTIVLISLSFSALGFLSLMLWAATGSVLSKLFSKYRMAFNIIMALLLVYCAYTVIK